MIYITGDKHGSLQSILEFTDRNHTTVDDVLIILGDAGYNYYCDSRDRRRKQAISLLPITLFCVHGNHEKRPYDIPTYKEVEFHGGIAYMEEEYPNLYFAKDAEVYNFNGNSCIVIGGAYSVDKYFRMSMGYQWFSNEQPDEDVKNAVFSALFKRGNEIDVILSHTCPQKYEPVEMYLGNIDQSTVDKSTEEFLDGLEDAVAYKRWYCGHWHTDKEVNKIKFMYHGIEEFNP